MANPIDDEARLRSALVTQWSELQTLVQGYVDEYYFKGLPKRATAQEWISDGFKFTSDLAMLWLRGVGIGVKEGARMAANATKADGDDKGPDGDGADQPNGGSDFAAVVRTVVREELARMLAQGAAAKAVS